MSRTVKQRFVRKGNVRKHVAAAINALSFESPTMSEVKRKWSNLIVTAKEQM